MGARASADGRIRGVDESPADELRACAWRRCGRVGNFPRCVVSSVWSVLLEGPLCPRCRELLEADALTLVEELAA